MQVILLCAGSSSRMDPISDKSLLSFSGKTLFEHQLEKCLFFGLKECIVVVNAQNKTALEKLAKNIPQMNCIFVEQKILEDGMKGAIEVCKIHIKNEVLIINSNDIVENLAFEQILAERQKKEFDAVICGKVVEKYFPGGYLTVDENYYLKNIVEKPGEGNEPSNLVNLVLHYFKDFTQFCTFVENFKNSTDDAYEQALNQFASEKKVKVTQYSGSWQAIKYPWHVLDAQFCFFPRETFIHPSVKIAEHVTIKGNVYIDENVKIFEHATISGPCYIGKNSIIANNALVRESHIGENCVIGYSTEVARSYLHKNIWTHSNYIGDSIIDENVSFGAGTITGNLRLDENNIFVEVKGKKLDSQKNKLGSIIGSGTRIGTQCSINPGIKIGKNVFVGSSVNLWKNIPDNIFVCVKQEYIEKENIMSVDTEKRKKI